MKSRNLKTAQDHKHRYRRPGKVPYLRVIHRGQNPSIDYKILKGIARFGRIPKGESTGCSAD